jgi:hypothetical protein
MNADEIVRALRCVQEKHRNDRLLTFQTDVSAMARDAADMIESLQAQLAEYDEIAAEYGIDGKTMLTLAKSQLKTAQDNVELMEQLEESQRRADAAVEDLRKLDCREPFGGKHCTHKSECYEENRKIGGNYPECGGCTEWQWRGPQDEKGEADG